MKETTHESLVAVHTYTKKWEKEKMMKKLKVKKEKGITLVVSVKF